MSSVFRVLASFSLVTVLVACGGGGGGSSASVNPSSNSGGGSGSGSTLTETVTISPSLGRITDASIKIYDASYSQVIGEGVVDETGKAVMEVSYSKVEPTIVELTAGPSSTYFDEAAGEVVLPEGTKLHALTEDPRNTAVTPFTELAWQLALLNGDFPLDAERVRRLNSAVTTMIGGVRSIDYAPTILAEMPTPNSQTVALSNLHAAALAAFAQVGKNEAAPALAVLDSLTSDISEGYLSDFGGNYVYDDFAEAFREELESWITTYGNGGAEKAIFVMPLPARTIDVFANIPVRERILEMEYGNGIEVAYSRDGGSDWALFSKGSMVSFHREGSMIGMALGDNGMDPDAGEFVDGWSVDMATAEYKSLFDDPQLHGVQVEIPTGNAFIKRYIAFITRDGVDFDDIILLEDDIRTVATEKLAHVLSFDSLDFMESGVYDFFTDVHAMANEGTGLTVILSEVPSRVCADAFIGTNNSSRYPKLVGIIHDDDSDTETLEPQRIRYAEAGAQREILFEDDTIFRLNDDTGRIDYIYRENGGYISQWATNDSTLIAEFCPD